jgi:4-hydroxy-2-oxoheptanedioate aldolase
MRGLAKGGPTRSGHRTPAVIVNVPVNGTDEATVRANAWMFQQVLATGVHGVLLCHADTPGAVRAFVEAVRFPANGGRRGVHGNTTAAKIWGITADEYAEKADVWPLNPKGELLLGLKIEDKFALENAEASTKIAGIAFAEWGPGDMAFSLGVRNPGSGPMPAELQAARARVFAATRANKLFFLNSVNPDNVVDMLGEGVMIGAADERAADIGRRHTRREMPW